MSNTSKRFKVILERKVTYLATLEIGAENFEDAKQHALEFADAVAPLGHAQRVFWRESASQTTLKNIVQE
jgi:hypothetical protein